MKRVVILHPSFWSQAMGGAEIQIKFLVDKLIDQNFEVHYIYEDKGLKFNNSTGIHLHPLDRIRIKKRFGNRWFLYKKRILEKLNEIQPSSIYTRFYSSWSGFASEYAVKNKIIHIWAIASDSDLYQKKLSIKKPLDFFEKKYVNRAFQYSSYIITQNQYQQEKLSDKYNRKGVVIKQSSETCNVSKINKQKSKTRILWVANLKKIKQPHLFIDIAYLLRENKDLEFKMIGRSSDLYSKQLSFAQKNIPNFEYLGELTNDGVNELFCNSDILINTSEYEGFSNTFVQAWMRKVVVISMNSNPDQILTEQQIGFLCPSIESVVEKITELKANKSRIEAMGEKAFLYSNENHSVYKNLNAIIKLLG